MGSAMEVRDDRLLRYTVASKVTAGPSMTGETWELVFLKPLALI
jgi:hypothetical protein